MEILEHRKTKQNCRADAYEWNNECKIDRILVFGDSIAYGIGDRELGWVLRLRKWIEVFSAIKVYNLSIPGETSRGLLKRVKSEMEPRIGNRTLVLFAIGTNDSSTNGKGENSVPIEEFKSNISKLASMAMDKGNVAFVGMGKAYEELTTPVPWNRTKYYTNESMLLYDSAIRETCSNIGIEYIGLGGIDWNGKLADGLHPNGEGHGEIFKAVRNWLLPKTIDTIYDKYEIPWNLRRHMKWVAMVGRKVAKCCKEKGMQVDVQLVERLCLLHDMGNILKYELSQDSAHKYGISESEFGCLKKIKQKFIERYGKDEKAATIEICRELGLHEEAGLMERQMSKMSEELLDEAWELKILTYADLRVAPKKVTGLRERVRDLCERRGYSIDSFDYVFRIEEEIVEKCGRDCIEI